MILLLASRAAIIMWVTMCLMPVEFVYDAIEIEIERRREP